MPAAPASASGEPEFDFINKSGQTVTILVLNDGKGIKQEVVYTTGILSKLVTSRNVSADIDINQETDLIVVNATVTNPIIAMKTAGTEWMIYIPDGIKEANIYSFKPGKKIYVTLHSNSELDPQTGPNSGHTGKTDAGYSLSNMVSKSDIKLDKRTVKD